jgi:murein DD-endopeptidase MepM/ murein hydrolase activator NlpD/GH24 family phage-related lysozyme (muramidase)
MKRNLTEELERIHTITYGKKVIEEQGFLDKILKGVGLKKDKVDDPKKADLVSDDVQEFYKTLEKAAEQGGISEQERGSMTFQKEVESMQIGLVLLGYQLPIHGVDGLFGPETAAAVRKFIQEKLEKKESISESTLSSPIGDTSVSSPYGPRWGKTHHGVDLKASSGTQIKSPLDGEVIDAEIRNNDCGGTIYIKHADGYKTRYCHCKQINVSKGDIVKKGDVVGLSGGGNGEVGQGRSTGPHLHFEVYKDGKTVNPMDHLGSEVGEFVAGSGSSKADTKATPEMLIKLIELLKEKGVKSEDLKGLIDQSVKGIQVSLTGDWLNISKDLLRKWETFTDKASWDENAYRGGYGSSKKLVNGRLETVTQSTTWTKQEAEDTLDYEIKNTYAPIIAKQLGLDNWNKLNDRQKASLISLGYNAGPYFISARSYGKEIKYAIENGNMELAAQYIEKGPTTGAGSGSHYSGLQRRRSEESKIFLS